MPGGPDYPHDRSTRYSVAVRDAIRIFRAADNIQGIVHTPEGDIRTWVISAGVQSTRKDLTTALAYLEIADRLAAEHDAHEAQRTVEIRAMLSTIQNELQQLRGIVREQDSLIKSLVGLLGVFVPNWHNRIEIEQGDDMGMVILSANEIGLVIEIIPLQYEPGFEHEEVVSMEPPADTLVARGSTVRVRMNFEG